MEIDIRKVKQGDADALAYIQTESWKTAFKGIIDDEMLEKVKITICKIIHWSYIW